jgi:hypothetical protein
MSEQEPPERAAAAKIGRPTKLLLLAVCILPVNQALQTPEADHLLDPFATGWMLRDTNGDGIVDFVAGRVVVPINPSAAENAAAADIAARLGFASTGLTLPLVIAANEDRHDGPRIFVGGVAAPFPLQESEGGVFAIDGNLAIVGHDDADYWLPRKRSRRGHLIYGRFLAIS